MVFSSMNIIQVKNMGKIKTLVYCIYDFADVILSNHRIRMAEKQYNDGDIIKVGFIVQMPEVWDKQKRVFEKMLQSENFDPQIIVIPPFDFEKDKLGTYGKERDYYNSLYDSERVMDAIGKSGETISLKNMKFDYIFFERPYERYLPAQYHAMNILKYSKTCYIPYAFDSLKSPKLYYKRSFFNNLYYFFCCSKYQYYNNLGISKRKSIFLGYPSLDAIHIDKEKNRYKSVLWTPRWISSEDAGPSSFLAYKEKYVDYKIKNPEIDMIIRPHPLTFSNLVKQGLITDREVIEFKERLRVNDVIIDNNVLVEDTFKNTDILLTDYSSIIIYYFLTGKPIIYCGGRKLNYGSEYLSIIDCCYNASNWDEVKHYLDDLINGKDTLKQKRIECIKKIKSSNDSAYEILETLKKDYQKAYKKKGAQ